MAQIGTLGWRGAALRGTLIVGASVAAASGCGGKSDADSLGAGGSGARDTAGIGGSEATGGATSRDGTAGERVASRGGSAGEHARATGGTAAGGAAGGKANNAGGDAGGAMTGGSNVGGAVTGGSSSAGADPTGGSGGTRACSAGDTRAADDGCNTCECSAAGQWMCTIEPCADAPYCTPGDGASLLWAGPCNSCSCTDSGWMCTALRCDCNGYDEGATLSDECYTCTCQSGFWQCGSNGEQEGSDCSSSGTCTPGLTKPVGDDCNYCVCGTNSRWACTSETCATPCSPGATRPAGDECNTCVCNDDGAWACSMSDCSVTLGTGGSGHSTGGGPNAGGHGGFGAAAAGGEGGRSSPTCDGRSRPIVAVAVSSPDLGTCCSGGYEAMVDGSGLTGVDSEALHDCTDENMWASQPPALAGLLVFDLGRVYALDELVIWNSAQASGQRGAREVTVTVSVDGVTYAPLAGAPETLQIRTDCPSESEVFALGPGAQGRYVRLAIERTYTDGGATSVGFGEIRFYGSCE